MKMWWCGLVVLAPYTVFFFQILSASEWDNKDEMRTLGDEMGGEICV